MPARLKNLVINEVSMVDNGANPHAMIALFKRELNAEPVDSVGDAEQDQIPEEVAMTQTLHELTKALDDINMKCKAAELALKKAEGELALLKMPDAHRQYIEDAGMSESEKAAFIAKSDADRNAHITSNPAVQRLPANIVKALDDAKRDREILMTLQEKDAIETFAKRAVALGCPRAFGEVLRKASQGNPEAFAKIEETIAALNQQVKTGKLFDEFGTASPGAATAYDAIKAKADELRKAMPQLTPEQAFSKVYMDHANRDLVVQHKREAGRPA
ncbi:MAG: hypothetical protein ACRD36_01300 [Candidatus Acidiferrum sp.]